MKHFSASIATDVFKILDSHLVELSFVLQEQVFVLSSDGKVGSGKKAETVSFFVDRAGVETLLSSLGAVRERLVSVETGIVMATGPLPKV